MSLARDRLAGGDVRAMLEYYCFLVLLASCHETRGEDVDTQQQTYADVDVAYSRDARGDASTPKVAGDPICTHNCMAIAEELSKKPAVTMNGHNNFHVGQQIFYVYDEQQFKRLLSSSDDRKGARRSPSDYLVTPNIGTHKLHPRKLAWNRARKVCIEEGGHLAVINSFSEEKILLRTLHEGNVGRAWLGLHDLYEEGDWVTVTDEALGSTGYTRWTSKFANQPDNFGGNQNCASLIVEGGMDDDTCSSPLPFLCEIPA